jgi:hypothetical protein
LKLEHPLQLANDEHGEETLTFADLWKFVSIAGAVIVSVTGIESRGNKATG